VSADEQRGLSPRERFELVRVYPDPIEGFNRPSLGFTKWIVDWGLHPVARGWRAITPRPMRIGIGNFAYNLGFPVRFVSLLLQAELRESGEETAHFLVNTTIGLCGIFDVAKRMGIETYRADFGLAFARWGVGPGFYLVIPLLGPSTGRDGVGRIFDAALSPTTYLPGVGVFFAVNNFADRITAYDTLVQSDLDFYSLVRATWALRRRIDATRYEIPEADYASADPEPSLGVLAFKVKDPDFVGRAEEWSVVSPRTGRRVPFSVWLQPQAAPIVYLIPGIGAHRRSATPTALAELLHEHGYSVAVVSSPFHSEFIASGLSALYPGYTPGDAMDLYQAFSALDKDVRERHPGALGHASLLGYSLGGLEALRIAQLENEPGAAISFDRVVAINPPVDISHASRQFDRYFDAPLEWSEPERTERVLTLAMKLILLAQDETPEARLPFDRVESEFLVGLSVRTSLVQALEAIALRGGGELNIPEQRKDTQGVLYAEINASSLRRYAEELAVPSLVKTYGADRSALFAEANLPSLEQTLRSDTRIRALTNADDFILDEKGLAWLQGTLGARIRVFPEGGHLGNLSHPDVQKAILDALGPDESSPVGAR
jgi:ABC-type transporter lipoprotein component MlaA/pimeloyl-ACP methyl ester carboxylesterase